MDFGKLLSISFFKDTPLWARIAVLFILIFFGCFIMGLLAVKDDLKELIQETSKQEPIKKIDRDEGAIILENEDMLKQMRDSIAEAKANRVLENNKEISRESILIKTRLNYCNSVSYWKVHNNGEPIEPDKRPFVVVLISSSADIEFDYKDSNPIEGGYYYFAKQMLEQGSMSYPNVTMMNSVYQGKTRKIMDQNRTVSIMGATVKHSPLEWYFVSFSFSKPSSECNNPNDSRELNDFRRFVQKRQ